MRHLLKKKEEPLTVTFQNSLYEHKNYFKSHKYRAKIEIRFYLKIISYLFAWKKIDNVQSLIRSLIE